VTKPGDAAKESKDGFNRSDASSGLSRRAWLKLAASVGVMALSADPIESLAWSATPPTAAAKYPVPPEWTGHNRKLGEYFLAQGYPAYEPHPRYLGELHGSWSQIGRQYGERAGDLIRFVYEGWYRELLPVQGSSEIISAYLVQQERYYEFLVPEALEMMHGIADGAATELSASAFPRELSHFHKILMINSYYGLKGKPPVSSTAELASTDDEIHCCSGAVILGPATRDGKAIHVSSEDQHFFPQEYLVTFIANPTDRRANRFTVTDSAGEIGSEHAQNDRGVTVSGYAGGSLGILGPTLDAPFTGYRRPGLDWQLGNFYAAAFAQSAREAVELLTVGRPEYRAKSGHKIVVGKCTRGVNWVVSDRHEAFVVESIPADEKGLARYAIRVPGAMGETGSHYVVSTNNVEAKDSYNEDNRHDPAHPMSQHGNGAQNPTHFGLNGAGTRFWTLMGLTQKNYGQITVEMVQEWRRTHFIYDASGTRHDYVEDAGNRIPVHLVPDTANLCRHSSGPVGVDTNVGINTYVSLSVADDLTSFRTKGRPCEWDGPWDRLSLRNPPRLT
jgi:hypothetical protein